MTGFGLLEELLLPVLPSELWLDSDDRDSLLRLDSLCDCVRELPGHGPARPVHGQGTVRENERLSRDVEVDARERAAAGRVRSFWAGTGSSAAMPPMPTRSPGPSMISPRTCPSPTRPTTSATPARPRPR